MISVAGVLDDRCPLRAFLTSAERPMFSFSSRRCSNFEWSSLTQGRLRQCRVPEANNHLDSWGPVRKMPTSSPGMARLLVDSDLRKQNDAAQMKQWLSQTEFRKLMRVWCGLAVTPPWRDTGSEFNCKWGLYFFSLPCPGFCGLTCYQS